MMDYATKEYIDTCESRAELAEEARDILVDALQSLKEILEDGLMVVNDALKEVGCE